MKKPTFKQVELREAIDLVLAGKKVYLHDLSENVIKTRDMRKVSLETIVTNRDKYIFQTLEGTYASQID